MYIYMHGMYVCMHACMHGCMYVCMYVCMYNYTVHNNDTYACACIHSGPTLGTITWYIINSCNPAVFPSHSNGIAPYCSDSIDRRYCPSPPRPRRRCMHRMPKKMTSWRKPPTKTKKSKDSPTAFPIGEIKSNRLGKVKITTVDKLPWGKLTVRCGKSNICLDLFSRETTLLFHIYVSLPPG